MIGSRPKSSAQYDDNPASIPGRAGQALAGEILAIGDLARWMRSPSILTELSVFVPASAKRNILSPRYSNDGLTQPLPRTADEVSRFGYGKLASIFIELDQVPK